MFVGMLLEKFLTYLSAEKRYSIHTVMAYERDILQFAGFLGFNRNSASEFVSADGTVFDPAVVTTDDIRRWILYLSEQERLSAACINRKTSSLRSLFRYLRKIQAIDNDPFPGIGFRKMPSRLPSFVPEKNMSDVLSMLEAEFDTGDYILRRNSLILLVLYTTGLRLSEIHAVRLGNFSQGYSVLRVLGKGNKERVIPVLDYTRCKIVEFLGDLKSRDFCISSQLSLFLSKEGKPLSRNAIYRIVRDELSKAGVQGKCSPHLLRHTFATHMLDGGADIREIQEMLGHTSLAATQVYTHNSIAKLKEVYAKAHPRSRQKEQNKP